MPDLISFFTILVAGLVFSHLFNRLHLPWVVALIFAGVVIGPNALNIFTLSPAIELLSEIGLVFLMFMAGLEMRFSTFKELKDNTGPILILNSLIPFIVGTMTGLLFDLGMEVSLLMGIIFTSSSIAVIIPSLEANGLLKTKLGKTITVTAMVEDIISLILLSILFQSLAPTANLPLPLFYLLIVILLVILKLAIPTLRRRFTFLRKKDIFDNELRQIFAILIGVVIIFEIIGLHPIIAGFFTGIALSDSIKDEMIKSKLHAISYGIFIPIFFISVGASTNLGVLFGPNNTMFLTVVIIVASIGAKLFSGFIGGKLSGYTSHQSLLIGAATTPHLSTALAVVIAGSVLGLIDESLTSAIVALTVATSFFGPSLISKLAHHGKKN